MKSTTTDRAFDPIEVAHLEHGLRLAGALLDREAKLRQAGPCLACRDRAHREFALRQDAAWTIFAKAIAPHIFEPKTPDLQEAAKAFAGTDEVRFWRAGEAA